MSFSSQIKEKLCKSEYGCMNCAAYELSGALMFGGNIGSDSIKFATENENIAKRITADINTAYGIQVETQVISKVQRIIIDNIGMDWRNTQYPRTRTFMVGVNVNF